MASAVNDKSLSNYYQLRHSRQNSYEKSVAGKTINHSKEQFLWSFLIGFIKTKSSFGIFYYYWKPFESQSIVLIFNKIRLYVLRED